MAVSIEAITQDQLDALCVGLREGSSVRRFVEENDAGFSRSTLYAWLEQFATDEQKDQYARALERSADADADDIRYIAEGMKKSDGRDGAAVAKTQIDAFKWTAGQKKPKVYGNSTTLKGDKDSPLVPAVFTLNLGQPNTGDDDTTE